MAVQEEDTTDRPKLTKGGLGFSEGDCVHVYGLFDGCGRDYCRGDGGSPHNPTCMTGVIRFLGQNSLAECIVGVELKFFFLVGKLDCN